MCRQKTQRIELNTQESDSITELIAELERNWNKMEIKNSKNKYFKNRRKVKKNEIKLTLK
jgi:hypothetical protein